MAGDVAARVLATDKAKKAAREMTALLEGDVKTNLGQLRRYGQALSNPAIWDGPQAAQFRTRTWPPVRNAVDRALHQMEQLRLSSEHVIDDIMKAGSGGLTGGAASESIHSNLWLRKLFSDVKGEIGKTTSYARWLGGVLKGEASEEALAKFMGITNDLGLAGKVLSKLGVSERWLGYLGEAKGVLGKVALPLTMVSGAIDVVTGGGYSGWRGVADRVMGGVGFAGAGALTLVMVGAVSLGPVGLAVAGAAVLAYGAWSLGNLIWDHHEAIGRAATVAWDWTSHAVSGAAHTVGTAVNRAAHVVGNVISAPLRLIPHFSIF